MVHARALDSIPPLHICPHAKPTASVWWMLFFTKFLRSIFVFGFSHGFGLNSFFCKTPYDLRPLLCGSGNLRSPCLYTIKSRVAFYLLQWSLYYFLITTVTKYQKLLGFTVLHLRRSEGLSVQWQLGWFRLEISGATCALPASLRHVSSPSCHL